MTTNFFLKYRPLLPFRRKRGLINLQDGSKFYNFLYIKKTCSCVYYIIIRCFNRNLIYNILVFVTGWLHRIVARMVFGFDADGFF
jgi:hypothetical protein